MVKQGFDWTAFQGQLGQVLAQYLTEEGGLLSMTSVLEFVKYIAVKEAAEQAFFLGE